MKQFKRDVFDFNIMSGKSRTCELGLTADAIMGLVINGHGAKSFLDECCCV